MQIKLTKHITNVPHKIVALVIGYGIWFLLSQTHTQQITVEVPVCFYGAAIESIAHAPETISITLSGTRNCLAQLDLDALAVHIDADDLIQGQNPIDITEEKLFLPDSVNVVHCNPSYLTITTASIESVIETVTSEA